jgi:DNA-binding YbaB/EbfC family protein
MAETPSLNDMMQQLQRAQMEMKVVREKLQSQYINASSEDGTVTVKISGDSRILGVTIDPEAVAAGDVAKLEAAVAEAVIKAQRQAAELADKHIGSIAGGLGYGPGQGPGPGPGPGGL